MNNGLAIAVVHGGRGIGLLGGSGEGDRGWGEEAKSSNRTLRAGAAGRGTIQS